MSINIPEIFACNVFNDVLVLAFVINEEHIAHSFYRDGFGQVFQGEVAVFQFFKLIDGGARTVTFTQQVGEPTWVGGFFLVSAIIIKHPSFAHIAKAQSRFVLAEAEHKGSSAAHATPL